MKDIRAMGDSELSELVATNRETIRQERFKDTFSRKKSVIEAAKNTIARALTEQNARRKSADQK